MSNLNIYFHLLLFHEFEVIQFTAQNFFEGDIQIENFHSSFKSRCYASVAGDSWCCSVLTKRTFSSSVQVQMSKLASSCTNIKENVGNFFTATWYSRFEAATSNIWKWAAEPDDPDVATVRCSAVLQLSPSSPVRGREALRSPPGSWGGRSGQQDSADSAAAAPPSSRASFLSQSGSS